MKISISVPSATAGGPPDERVLGDDAKREFISGWSAQGASAVQTGRYPRAVQVKKFARGNIETAVSFITSRTHASYAASLLFLGREIAQVLNRKGTLTVTQLGGTLTLEDAVVSAVAPVGEIHGTSTLIAYQIEGGAFTFTSTT